MPWSFYRGKRCWRQFHPFPYELHDAYGVNHAAVLPSPQLCVPGPGSWLVTDTASRMSISGGKLTYASDPSPNWDRCLLVSTLPFTRKAGRYCQFEWTPTSVEYSRLGWNFVNAASSTGTGANGSIQYNEACVYLAGSGMVLVTDGLDVVSPLYPYATGTSYTFRVYDNGLGWLYYVCPTASLPNGWVLLWERFRSFTHDTRYVLAQNNHGQTGTSAEAFVRQGLVKPPVAAHAQPGASLLLSGAADGLFDAEVRAPTNDRRKLVFRCTDPNNYWYVALDTTAQSMVLDKVVGGVDTPVATTSVLWVPGAYYRLRVLCFANHIRTFFGINSGPYTDDSFNQSAVLLGTQLAGNFNDGDVINMRQQTGGHLLLN
jgi:hypothetical protein